MDMTAIVIAASIPSAITGFCFWLIEQNIQKRAEKERKEREARQAKVDERERDREQSELCIINCINASLALQVWEVKRMYNRLKKLYLAGRLNDTGLENAVTRGWITEDQKAEIIEAKKEQDAPKE